MYSLCYTTMTTNFRTPRSPRKETRYPVATALITTPVPIPLATNLLSVSRDLTVLDISNIWNHKICGLYVGLLSLMVLRCIHIVTCCHLFHSFLLPNTIIHCLDYTTFYLFIHQLMITLFLSLLGYYE